MSPLTAIRLTLGFTLISILAVIIGLSAAHYLDDFISPMAALTVGSVLAVFSLIGLFLLALKLEW